MDCQGSHACTRIDPVQEQQLSDATLHSPSSKAVALMELAVQQNGGNAHMLDRSASTEEILAAWREIRLFLHNQPSKSQQSQQQELQQQEGARQKTYATAAGECLRYTLLDLHQQRLSSAALPACHVKLLCGVSAHTMSSCSR